MVPGEGKDFPGSHGGFDGEEEGGANLLPARAVKTLDNRRYLIVGNSPASCWRLAWALNAPYRVDADPLPLPDCDTK